MKTPRKSRRSHAIVLALAAGLLAGAIALPTPLRAQAGSSSELANEKMQLQLQALDAKTTGDYAKAKDLLNKIIALDPKDPNNTDVQRQIATIDAALASQSAGKPTIFDANGSGSAAPSAMTARQLAADSPAPATTTDTAAPAITSESKTALDAEAARQAGQIASIRKSIEKAKALEASGDYAGARDALDAAKAQVPPGMAFADIRNAIAQETANSWYLQAVADYNGKKLATAKDDLAKYVEVKGGADSRSNQLQKNIAAAQKNPLSQDIAQISPGFEELQDKVQQLMVTGRAQFLYGDFDGAMKTFNVVITYSPDNIEAKAYMMQINQIQVDKGYMNRLQTRANMLSQVTDDWSLPVYNQAAAAEAPAPVQESAEMKKLQTIFIPSVDIQVPTPLEQVVQVLHDESIKFDPDGKGVNMQVFVAEGDQMPKVTLAGVTNLSIAEILSIACKKAGYGYGSEGHIIALRKGGTGDSSANSGFVRQTIGLSDGAQELLGLSSGGSAGATSAGPATAANPFETPGGNTTAAAAAPADTSGASSSDLADQLQKKFVENGIEFPPGSKLTLLGRTNSKISVFNTLENINSLRNFLNTLSDVKQVQIESRFLDVTQSALKSFGARWAATNSRLPNDFLQTGSSGQTSNLRSLSTTFSQGSANAAPTVITGLTGQTINGTLGGSGLTFLPGSLIDNQVIPTLPTAVNTGVASSDVFSGVVSWLDGYRIQLVLDMLDQENGSDLMTSPKVTVMDGVDATILVAQDFKYPQQFQAVTATVSPASGNSGAGGGIAVAAGNPNQFVDENIGVSMRVHPDVQPDDSIKIALDPKVTEFDGFVEYGSASIAIQGTITAIVPSGVIQPIFDQREMSTTVTVSDGATIVMGGMTRDEVDSVNDKVPVLGDIPLLGRLFQSKAETSEKRNLLIFVTANLIGPGGSPALQTFQGLQPGTLFTNPTLVMPSGSFERTPAKSLVTPAAAPQP